MKDLLELVQQCQMELSPLRIPWGRVRNWSVNSRAKARWGLCTKVGRGEFDVQMAVPLLDDSLDDQLAKDTIVPELLHTVPGCFKHTGKWKQYVDLINKLMPHCSIKARSSYEDTGAADLRTAPIYKYILKCEQCGREVRRQKKCSVVGHPENYCRRCGG